VYFYNYGALVKAVSTENVVALNVRTKENMPFKIPSQDLMF
jgi:hypothetical protein